MGVPRTGTDWLKAQTKKITEGAELPVTAHTAGAVEVESWLQSHQIAYAPPACIPMSVIDEKRSRTNQARRDPIVTESVDRFAAAMRAGKVFPPIVTYPSGGKLVIIDGNNRQAAARKAGLDTVFGVIIADDTPSELIQLLTVEANGHHGVTPELSWRLQQAFYLVSLGFTDQVAAEAAAVTIGQLRNHRAVAEADQRARAMRIGGFGALSLNARQALGVLKDEAVFFQAAKVSVDTAMTVDEIRDLVREVKARTSEGARIEFIGRIAKERGIEAATKKAMGRAVGRVSSPKQSLVAGIGKVLKVDEAALVRQIVTTTDRDLIRTRLGELERKLIRLSLALSTLDTLDGGAR